MAQVLERRTNGKGLVYYVSAKLRAIGVRHGFSTRLGGISPPPFDSLNLGNPNGCAIQDDYDRIWANYRRLLTALDCPGEPPLRTHQVHAAEVASVKPDEPFDTSCKADALVSTDGQRPISVRIADCVPVLISGPDGTVVAAVHAGWRGIVAGVIAAAISRVRGAQAGIASDSLIAAIGPCIGAEAFEVGAEVLIEFEKQFPREPPLRKLANGKGLVDLRTAALLQLLQCGLSRERIDSTDRCTYRDADEFFSHRRDRGVTGRMAAVIAANKS